MSESMTPQEIDANGRTLIGILPAPSAVLRLVLVSGTAQYPSVPSGYGLGWFVVGCQSGLDVMIQLGATSGMTTPTTSDATAGAYPAMDPTGFMINGAATVGVLPLGSGLCTLTFYK